ncbi:MAG: CAP domain-containing protein [Salinivirgaceae bacterium]|nr:CAP domain-containing protein [Salinivirgaceae bacterium]
MKKIAKFFSIFFVSGALVSYTSCEPDFCTGDPVDKNSEEPAEPNEPTEQGGTSESAASKYFTQSQLELATTTAAADYLTAEEKLVVFYCNLARLDGKAFVEAFLSDLKTSQDSYEKSLIDTLVAVKDFPMLVPNKKLSEAAAYHANDIGKAGVVQHESTDGTKTFDRIKKYYQGGYMAENISCGYSDALSIVRQLLVDKGVESLGHRKNILGNNYTRIGVAIREHATYRHCCVQDFSDARGD